MADLASIATKQTAFTDAHTADPNSADTKTKATAYEKEIRTYAKQQRGDE